MNLSYITPELFEQIKAESPTLQKLTDSQMNLNTWRDEIKSRFMFTKDGICIFHITSNKIEAIKWLRDATRANDALLDVFEQNGYSTYKHLSNSLPRTLSLYGAKLFVESCEG